MINHWTDRRLKINLLSRLRKTGGYSTTQSKPWNYHASLADGNGVIIFTATNYVRAQIINEVLHHYSNKTNF